MRTLQFGSDDPRYERVHTCCVTGAPERDRKRNKQLGAITDALEAFGVRKPSIDLETGKVREHRPDDIGFYVTAEGGTLVLEEADYDLVKSRVDAAIAAGVHPALARSFEDALAWLESLPQQDAKPVEA